MGGCSGRSVWSGRRKSFNHLVRKCWWGRMSVMRYCVGLISAMVLLAGCSFGQASTSTLTAAQAAPVSRPIEVKATDVKANIDLKPDATGVVPPEQIRDLLRRAEEKDLEQEQNQ